MMESTSSRTGFDTVGDAAIIKQNHSSSRTEMLKTALWIMHANGNIKRVFKKSGKTEGKERVAKLTWLAGARGSVVLHRENGSSFYVDLKKVYFSPRLSYERARISALVKRGEIVLDMFCGVGPYSIEIAKRAKKVYSIDINKTAIELLKKNIKLNKTSNVEAFRGNSNIVTKRLNQKFDRIVMNFPLNAKKYLPAALKVAAPDCVIHYYFFSNRLNGHKTSLDNELSKIKKILGHRFKIIKTSYRSTGEVAPYLSRACLDIRLRRIK